LSRDMKAQQDLTFVLDGPHGPETVRGVAVDDVVATLAEMRRADGDTPVTTGSGAR